MTESKAAKAAAKVLRQSHNEWSNKYFAIAVCAIMIIFTVHHWSSVIYFKYGPKKSHSALTGRYRQARRLLSTTVIGLRIDRSLLYIIYWAINLILTLTNVQFTISYVGKRLGWIAVTNLVLLVFLALKNTPLAPLTAKSYEKLRPLHKVSGYTCIFTSCLHAIVYLVAWSETGSLEKMREVQNFSGAIAGVAMLIIGLSTITFFMRNCYELFYLLHILMFILILITVGMHRPKFSTSTLIIVVFIACLWMLDRIVRGSKLIWNFFGNSAIVTALPNNAIRMKLSRRMNTRAGSHAFLWIPSIRAFETHPFTMLSSHPTEMVIRVYDGFTYDLYKAAQETPGRSLRCSIDGGYGQVPDFKVFEKVILVAGGSGASFTFSVALDVLNSMSPITKAIDFIWVVRHQECLEWFAQELKELEGHSNVNVLIHITRHTISSGRPLPASPSDLAEKTTVESSIIPAESSSVAFVPSDVEKDALQNDTAQDYPSFEIVRGVRPNLHKIIGAAAISNVSPDDRIIVGACGPSELMDATRRVVLGDLHDNGPSISIYTEEFEW